MPSSTTIVFMGSPALAVPSLRALAEDPRTRVVGVFSQPPRPVGRRGQVRPSAVHEAARALEIPVLTPARAGDTEAMAQLAVWQPDLIVVCAYGRILPQRVLDVPPLGPYNLHFSHLPRWRGASPVQAAILAGDATTGVSLQRMVMELDAGPIAAETPPLPIFPSDTAETLGTRLADSAAELILEALPALRGGAPALRPQDPAGITLCGLIHKTDGALNCARDGAVQIERQWRAYSPWPGLFAYLEGKRIGLTGIRVGSPSAPPAAQVTPGTLLADGWVPAHEGWLQLLEVQPEGKRPMSWTAFLNGQPQALGQCLLPDPPPAGPD